MTGQPGDLQVRCDEYELRSVSTEQWRDAVEYLLGRDYLFCNLHATTAGEQVELRAVFVRNGEFQMISCCPGQTPMPTIVDMVPAAAWDEREAADLADVAFVDYHPRPLVTHPEHPEDWITSVRGRDTHQVAVGPVHAGVIESGHFRFHVVGERILHLDLQLFYKHRGLERAAEGLDLERALLVAQRACAACAVTNTVAYAHACEQALGLTPSPDLARTRTVLLELERLYNHLNDIAAVCAGVGFAPGNTRFAALKERAQRVNQSLVGHRFLFDTTCVGRSDIAVTTAEANDARRELDEINTEFRRSWHELLFHGSVQNRFDGVGILTLDDATTLGTVGPVARASGIADDARTASPRLAYRDFQPVMPVGSRGDVQARVEMRGLELPATFALLDELLTGGLNPATCESGSPEQLTGMAAVEGPRGRTFCTIERAGTTVTRMRLRTSSYANWPAVAVASVDNLLPEFPLINKSFELCYACCDR